MTELKTYPSKMSTKGRITIPAELRKKLRLRCGTLISLHEENGRLVLIPFKRLLDEMKGCLKPRPGEASAFEELFKERARERRREDLKAALYDAEFKRKKTKAEKIMRRYRNTLRALAK